MSFLLDALRKSERNAARRAVPTIHSSDPDPEPVLEEPGSAWWWLLLLPVLVVGAWFVLQRDGAVPSGSNPADSSTPAVRESIGPVRAEGEGRAETNERAVLPPPVQPEGHASTPRGARTPVEMIEPADPGDGLAAEPRVGPERRAGATEAVAPDTAHAEVAGEGRLQAPRGSPTVRSPTVGDGSESGTTVAVARTPAAPRRNYIDYQQLPSHVKDQLPVFNMTVLVYAEQPSDRFILMNGGRQREGDEPQPGLKLLEIRRDGALYLFQQYRFLVSR